jgi:M6 family metalloprotease-like protein
MIVEGEQQMKVLRHIRLRALCTVPLFAALMVSSTGLAGEQERLCGSQFSPAHTIPLSSPGGIYLPSAGTIRVLLVFASFPDDETPHPYWPAHAAPLNMRQFVDSDTSTRSTERFNITRYFREMSGGRLNVIGEPIWIQSLHSQQEYLNGSYGRANWSILQESVDPLIDFSHYDHWTRTGNYAFEATPDGVVDMIVMVWRTTLWRMYGEASLGYKPGFTLDSTRIELGYPEYLPMPLGSGVTCEYPYGDSPDQLSQTIEHELGHWLLGGAHPYNGSTSFGKHAYWGMLCNGTRVASCANAYERERLGWMVVPEIGPDQTVHLTDFLTTGNAVKYHPPSGEPYEYFYIENHQFISNLDDVSRNPTDKGVWVLHQEGPYLELDNVKIIPSDGTWQWDNPGITSSCYDLTLPVFSRGVPDVRYGVSHRDQIPTATSAVNWMMVLKNEEGLLQCGVYFAGENIGGAFTPGSNPVYSPFSNPAMKTWSRQIIPIAIEMISDSAGIVTVQSFGSPLDASPARRFLGRSPEGTDSLPGSLPLAWGSQWINGQSIESDVIVSELQRAVGSEGEWEGVYSGSETTWRDVSLVYDSLGTLPVRFRVRVSDVQGKMSCWSNSFVAHARGTTHAINLDGPVTFHLDANYPNPFNPSTTITYSLETRSAVRLVVFSLLGEEVRVVDQGVREAGNHLIRFDGTGLSSGIFLCRLEAGRRIATIKMALIR